MYKIASNEPEWLELFDGVRAQFRPITRAAVRAARRVAGAILVADPEDDEIKHQSGEAYSAELIRRGLIAWEGIADRTGKKALAFTPEGVEEFIADAALFEAADQKYVMPFVLKEAEKNGFSGSRDGTSAGRTPAKRTARTATTPAKSVPTTSKRRAPAKAKPSGA